MVNGIISAVAVMVAVIALLQGRRASQRALLEGQRARIDANAPRVVVRTLAPRWPPVEPGLSAGSVHDLTAQHVFNIPGQAQQQVIVVCDFELCNEGKTTAFVSLPADTVTVKGAGQDPEEYSTEWNTLAQHRSSQLVLAPGAGQWITSRRGLSVEEWGTRLAAGDEPTILSTEITARDQFDDGVADSIVIDVAARPLVQSAENSHTWQLPTDRGGEPFLDLVTATVRPTRRQYRSAGAVKS